MTNTDKAKMLRNTGNDNAGIAQLLGVTEAEVDEYFAADETESNEDKQ